MFTYRQILYKAWQITWQHPALWFFGFFLAFLGAGGEIEILLGSISLGDSQALIPSLLLGLVEGGLFSANGLLGLAQALVQRPFSFLSLLLWLVTILVLAAIVVWLVVISQGAVIRGVVTAVKGKRESWAKHFEGGRRTFWPVLALNGLARAFFFIIFLGLNSLAFWQFSGSTLLFFLTFIMLVAAIVVASFIAKYAICAVVLRGEPVREAIGTAIALFRRHWLLSLEVATVLFAIYWLVTILLVNLLGSFFLSTLRVFGPEGSVALVAFIVILVITTIGQLLLAVFHWAAWVLVFEVLTSKKALLVSRLAGWFEKMAGQ